MNIADEKTWLENGMLKGRKVTRCQRKTKAYKEVVHDLTYANFQNGHIGQAEPSAARLRGVYRGENAAGSVYAVLLTGQSCASHTAMGILNTLTEGSVYDVLSFRYDGDWNWTAVLLAELK